MSNHHRCCVFLLTRDLKAGLTELKQLAEEHLFKQLDAENILDELFSRFTSRYESFRCAH